jgi:hypothetical protein
LNNYWYTLFEHNHQWYTTSADRIEPHTRGTGYWHITDHQHPDYQPVASTSTLTVEIPQDTLRTDPAISPFVTARSIKSSESGSETTGSSNTTSSGSNKPTAHPSPLEQRVLAPLEEATLAAQVEHVLDIQEREPQIPYQPETPGYLRTVTGALLLGANVPPPPPLLQPAAQLPAPAPEPIQYRLPAPVPAPLRRRFPQPINPQMAQPAGPETGRLRGEVPDTFTGDRKKSELFKVQFKVYKGLNDNHEIMIVPYFRAMQFLSLIRGPLVDDWVSDQVTILMERAS